MKSDGMKDLRCKSISFQAADAIDRKYKSPTGTYGIMESEGVLGLAIGVLFIPLDDRIPGVSAEIKKALEAAYHAGANDLTCSIRQLLKEQGL